MASWKKIITSGSNADLNQISASTIRVKEITVTGSGTITADNFAIGANGNAIPVSAGGTGVKTLTAGAVLTVNSAGDGFTSTQSSSIAFQDLSGVTSYGAGLASASNSSTARGHLGLGGMATQEGSSVIITGGTIGSGTMPDIPISSSGFMSMSNASNVFSGSFRGDGSGLTGVSTVATLTDLTDISTANAGAGRVLVGGGSQFSSVEVGGDATLDSSGNLLIANDKIAADELGVTAGTATANKALVVDANKDINLGTGDITAISASFTDVVTSKGATINGSKGTFTDSDGNVRNIGLIVENDVSASGFVGEFFEISSSIVFTSASTAFGDSDNDVHTFNGDLLIGTGSTSLGPNDTGYPSYASSSTGIFGVLGMHDVSGSLGQNIDLRSAFGGVSGSFAGKFRGDGSQLTGLATDTFKTISVGSGPDVVASGGTDTLTFASSSGAGLLISSSATGQKIDLVLNNIPNTSLAQITTDNKVSVGAIDIDGATAISADLTSTDLFIVNDGASGGNQRKASISAISTFINDNSSITKLKSLTHIGTLPGLSFGSASVSGDITSSGNISSSGTLDVTGNVNFDGGLDVDGTTNLDNTDIDGTLVVDGTNISLDSTTTLNIDNSNTSNGITIGTATSAVPISIGHTTSVTTINDELDVTGTVDINDTTAATSTTTGALKVDGGVGVAGNLYVGGGTISLGTNATDLVDVKGNLTIGGNFTVLGDTTNVQVDKLSIEDNIIVIGSGSNTVDSDIDTGIAFERRNGAENKYAAFFFDETANRFAMGLTGDTAGGVITGSEANNPSLISNPSYVMTVKHDDTDPTIAQPMVSASAGNATDFGTGGDDSVGQVRIVNGDIFIYTD